MDHSRERGDGVVERDICINVEVRNTGGSDGPEATSTAVCVAALLALDTAGGLECSEEYSHEKEAVLARVGPDGRDVVVEHEGDVDAFATGTVECGAVTGKSRIDADKAGEMDVSVQYRGSVSEHTRCLGCGRKVRPAEDISGVNGV